jgi:hypothetical protein
VTKLYTGENAKFLVGNDKIPEYLSLFLAQMKNQSEGFRIGCVRDLRTASERLLVICELVPKSVYLNLRTKFSTILGEKQAEIERKFKMLKRDDQDVKDKHLRLFRPNLENPSNKAETEELNDKETQRNTDWTDVSIHTYNPPLVR